MPVTYDVKRLESIYQGEADISDRDAVVEIVAGTIGTMVSASRRASAALEDRYRNQLRTLRKVMRRLNIEADLPDNLRVWEAGQPSSVPPWMTRDAAEEAFEPLLASVSESRGSATTAPNFASVSASDRGSEAVSDPQRHMLELIYETFVLTGQLSTFQFVSGRVWEELETEPRDLYLDLAERGLVTPAMARSQDFQLREDTSVGVSLRGLMHLRQASEDLSRFVSIVRLVAERAGRFRPPSPSELARLSITSEEIRQHLDPKPQDRALQRLGVLISQEGWQLFTSFSRVGSDDWSFEVNLERARRYCDIHTVIDFLDISYPESQQRLSSPPASPRSLGVANSLSMANNRKVMVVHGRDRARDDLFGLLRALGLDPIEWSTAVKATGTTKPYTGQAVEAAFTTAQAAVILLVPEEQVALRSDLRDPKEPSDAQMAWQPRPNVFYEGGIAVTSHPVRTIVLELGRPRTATDLAGVNTVRIGSDQRWRHDLANRLRDAGCPANTEGEDWLTVGEFAEPELSVGSPALIPPASAESAASSYSYEADDHRGSTQHADHHAKAQLAAAVRSGNVLRVRQHADTVLGLQWRDQVELLVKETAGALDASRLTHSGNSAHWLQVLDDLAMQVGQGRQLTPSGAWDSYVETMANFKQALDTDLTEGEHISGELLAQTVERGDAMVSAWVRGVEESFVDVSRLREMLRSDNSAGMFATYEGLSEEESKTLWRVDCRLRELQPLLAVIAPYVEALKGD